MSVALQGSLLDTVDEVGLGRLDPAIRRTALTGGAWVDMRPGWLTGADELFSRLARTVPWQAQHRQMYDREVDVPRLLSFYNEDEQLPDPVLMQARSALSTHYARELGEPFRTAGLCLYRDGRDSVAWHGDTIGRGSTEDTMVAIISVGAPARCSCVPAAVAPDRASGTSWATATWWSWVGRASAPGSTLSPSQPNRSDHGSASSSGRAGSADPRNDDSASPALHQDNRCHRPRICWGHEPGPGPRRPRLPNPPGPGFRTLCGGPEPDAPADAGADVPRLGRRRPSVAPLPGSVVLGHDRRSRTDHGYRR